MDRILLTNIQHFSLHDGSGIRTTVFLKGCSLCCPWCSNPENRTTSIQNYNRDGIKGIYGRYMTADDIFLECIKDKDFYDGELRNKELWTINKADEIEKLPGGVTFSGGECLLQMKSLISVCKRLHSSGIHIAAETCLFVPADYLRYALEYIDFFYVDVKILDAYKCKEIVNGNLKTYLNNFQTLMNWRDEQGRNKPTIIRVPVIGTYTDSDANRRAVHDLLKKYHQAILKVELIKEHNLGESKYKSLGLKTDYHGVEDYLMDIYRDELSDIDIPIEICRV